MKKLNLFIAGLLISSTSLFGQVVSGTTIQSTSTTTGQPWVPQFTFSADNNSGMYRQSADKIGLVANGQVGLIVDGTSGGGRVGIGTTTPAFPLDVNTSDPARILKIRLGDKWLMSGVGDASLNDDWLRLFKASGATSSGGFSNYYGGFAAGKMWMQHLDVSAQSGGLSPYPSNELAMLTKPGHAYVKIRSQDANLTGIQLQRFNGSTEISTWSIENIPGTSTHPHKLRFQLWPNNVGPFEVRQDGIWATKICVSPNGTCPDYVFEENYNLKSLDEVEKYIKINKHLPNIPSANEIAEKGTIDLQEMTYKLLEKVEELTLYSIELNKQIAILKGETKAND